MNITHLTSAGAAPAKSTPQRQAQTATPPTGDGAKGPGFALQSFDRLVEVAAARLAESANLSEPRPVRVNLDIDEATNRVIAKVTDRETGELVRQIPAEELLRNAAGIQELLALSLDVKA
jgi:flagellar protein FlaG